jgi:hypothetical protein
MEKANSVTHFLFPPYFIMAHEIIHGENAISKMNKSPSNPFICAFYVFLKLTAPKEWRGRSGETRSCRKGQEPFRIYPRQRQ